VFLSPLACRRIKLIWQAATSGNPQSGNTRYAYDKFGRAVIVDGRVLPAIHDGRVLVYSH